LLNNTKTITMEKNQDQIVFNSEISNSIINSYIYWSNQKPGTKKNAAFLSFAENCEKENRDVLLTGDQLSKRLNYIYK